MSFIENDVLKEFNRISREITEVYYNISSNLGISDSTFIILYALVELGDGCRQADIVKAEYNLLCVIILFSIGFRYFFSTKYITISIINLNI